MLLAKKYSIVKTLKAAEINVVVLGYLRSAFDQDKKLQRPGQNQA